MTNQYSRRSFLKQGALGLAAASSIGMLSKRGEAAPRTDIPTSWDLEADIVVVGSGTGVTGAIAAADAGSKTIVLEKLGVPGGSTLMSGGVVWVPNNHVMKREGIHDSRENTLTYLNKLALGQGEDELIETFADVGPEMAKYVEENSPIKWGVFDGLVPTAKEKCSEYHPEWPGAVPVGRSLSPMVDGKRGGGPDLAIGLIQGAEAKGVDFHYNTAAKQLIVRKTDDGGHEVLGLVAEANGKEINIKAKQAILLAAGGFDCDVEMKQHFLKGPTPYWTGASSLTGDGILMAMSAGADLRNMNECWGMPVYKEEAIRNNANRRAASLALLLEKGKPGAIFVNRYGNRFCNEAVDYNSLWLSFFTWQNWGDLGYENLPAYIIFDGSNREKYTIAGTPAGAPLPDFVKKADTLEELAEIMGIDPAGLVRTVEAFNQNAEKGEDPVYHRGESLYDRAWAATPIEGPKATLGPIVNGPFYAAEIAPGEIGTAGGARVNKHSQVLDVTGKPIPRLYAAGNNSGVGGPGAGYGGAGGTIGPCMTFAYIAGIHASKLKSWK